MADLLDTKPHLPSNGWLIVNGKGDRLGITMLSPAVITHEAPGQTQTERLRWVLATGQVLPEGRWR